MLSLAAAARSLRHLGDDDRSRSARQEVLEFADRNQAPGLLRLAALDEPEPTAAEPA
jgi:hypothetical protein